MVEPWFTSPCDDAGTNGATTRGQEEQELLVHLLGFACKTAEGISDI